MPHRSHVPARSSSHSPARPSTTLLNLTDELHQLRLDAVGLKLVDPAFATSVSRFVDQVSSGVGNWPVWHALATLQDDTVAPPRSLQSSVFHVVDMVQKGLLHSTITSAADMAPAFKAIDYIIAFASSLTNVGQPEQAHEPSPQVSLARLARYALPSFTSAPRPVPSSAGRSTAQFRVNESHAAFEAALAQLSRVRPTYPLSSEAFEELTRAVEELETAVPSSTAWEALSIVKPRGGLPGDETSFQQQVMDRLHALVVELQGGSLFHAEGIRLQVKSILGIIDEGKQLADKQKSRSLAKRSLAGPLVSARTAARYRVSQEDLARRWR